MVSSLRRLLSKLGAPQDEVPDDQVLEYLASCVSTVESAGEFFEILTGFCGDWLDTDALAEQEQEQLFAQLTVGEAGEDEQATESELMHIGSSKAASSVASNVIREKAQQQQQQQEPEGWQEAFGRFARRLVGGKSRRARGLAGDEAAQLKFVRAAASDTADFDHVMALATGLFPQLMTAGVSTGVFCDALAELGGEASQLAQRQRTVLQEGGAETGDAWKDGAGENSDAVAGAYNDHRADSHVYDSSPAVLSLMELCPPSADPSVVGFIYARICDGNMDLAAQWMLDNGYDEAIRRKETAERKERQRLRIEQREEKRALENHRKLVLSRFDERLEKVRDGSKQIGLKDMVQQGRREIAIQAAKAKAQAKGATQVRYVDGKAVKMKGKEKFVVEVIGEEWDGGSRGRVKTKGKRGKGWA